MVGWGRGDNFLPGSNFISDTCRGLWAGRSHTTVRDGIGMGKILTRDSNQAYIKLRPPGLMGRERLAGPWSLPHGLPFLGGRFLETHGSGILPKFRL